MATSTADPASVLAAVLGDDNDLDVEAASADSSSTPQRPIMPVERGYSDSTTATTTTTTTVSPPDSLDGQVPYQPEQLDFAAVAAAAAAAAAAPTTTTTATNSYEHPYDRDLDDDYDDDDEAGEAEDE